MNIKETIKKLWKPQYTKVMFFILKTIFVSTIYSIILSLFIQKSSSEIIDLLDISIKNNKDAYVALGSILAVLFTLFGVYLTVGYRIKVEVLSKNRQEWINNVRSQTSQLLSKSSSFVPIKLIHGKNITRENILSAQKELDSIIEHQYNLKMLLSPQTQKSNIIINNFIIQLDALISLLSNQFAIESQLNENDLIKELIAYSKNRNTIIENISNTIQTILKTEWERVKRGD